MTTPSLGTALVTGASFGIGAAYADRLARRGYDLILVGRSGERLTQVAGQLSAETGRRAEPLVADLTKPADLARVAERLTSDASITLLVNNAGVAAVSALLDTDPRVADEMITLNVAALTRLTYAAVPNFVAQGRGTIINVASIVAVAPELLNGVYGASKAFVLAFTQSLQHELAGRGVRVQAVLPGAIATDLWGKAGVPIERLPAGSVMTTDDAVDASLAGLDQGEVITIPSLPDVATWNAFEAARQALRPGLSRDVPAARYLAVSR